MFLTGFTLGYRYIQKACEREGLSTEKLDSGLVHVVLGTIIGARLGHCLFYDPSYYLSAPWKILAVWEGGLASHGGGLGVIFALWLFRRKNPEFTFWWLLDRVAICTVLTGGFIRIGNLMNSEILGKPTGSDYGVIFQRVDNVPRHPAMIYESICYFVISALCYWLYWNWDKLFPALETKKKKKQVVLPPDGMIFGLTISLIFICRFFIEFAKENQESFNLGMPLNMGQLLSIPFILVGSYLVLKALKTQRNSSVSAP